MKKIFFIIFVLIYLASLKSIGFTKAVFTDTGTSSGSFSAGYWYLSVSNISHLVATPQESNDDPKATISWNTDQDATSNLEYGITSGGPYTLVLLEDFTAGNTFHSREITSLDPETTYYYRVRSKNSGGYETISSEYTFITNGVRSGDAYSTDIVINEFLPNPTGDDNAPMPSGEWVELYNRGINSVDLTGWFLTDSNPSRILNITGSNIVSSDLSTTDFWIAPGEFMVVYRDGDSDFALNNDVAGDQVNLYNNVSALIDQHIYNSGYGDAVLENKSFARFPDGSDTWFDPIPTPGGPNELELLQSIEPLLSTDPISATPTLEINFINDKKAISISIFNLAGYLELSYELIYTAYDVQKGVVGSGVDISGHEEYTKEIDLATCSNEICTYDENVSNLKLKVTLEKAGKESIEIEKNL